MGNQPTKRANTLAFVLWFFFGVIGAHNIYLGEWKALIIKLTLIFLAFLSFAIGFGAMADNPDLAASGMIASAIFLLFDASLWLLDLARMLKIKNNNKG